VDLVYGVPILLLLAMALIAARRHAKKIQRRALSKIRRRRMRVKRDRHADSASPRSDMRSTDAPSSIVDTLQEQSRASRFRRY
jgi:hypothetical protein